MPALLSAFLWTTRHRHDDVAADNKSPRRSRADGLTKGMETGNMLQGWAVIAVALGYIGFLFVVASYGDRMRPIQRSARWRSLIYPLTLAVYCTSWTFFGSVGLASRNAYDFLTIYIGPIIMFGLFWPLVMRVVRLAKAQNITSVADFIAARYGKGQPVAAFVALIAILGSVPYIALQLKAVSSSLSAMLAQIDPPSGFEQSVLGDIALLVALSMAMFAVFFGTRHTDATEHQNGLMLAIATESVVKLVAFLAVGAFVTFWMFHGPADLIAQASERVDTAALLARPPQFSTFAAMTTLSFLVIMLLPRQFHVAVVENNSEAEIRRAAWLFPLYLVLINIFVLPIALAGLLIFPRGSVDSDMFVLALPLSADSHVFALFAFVGGLSAATAMVIVETVALAIMASNDIIMPWVLQRREAFVTGQQDVGALLLTVRRIAIFVILLLAYGYNRIAGDVQLAAIGLMSFAAIAQLAPAFFGGLVWRRGTARGAVAGMTAGTLAWAYTLFLPSFSETGLFASSFLDAGPWAISWLRPQALFGIDLPPLAHGVLWSLGLNVLAYVAFSLAREPAGIERMQADVFAPSHLVPMTSSLRLWRSAVIVGELTTMAGRYVGEERARDSFEDFARTRRLSLDPMQEADFQLLRHAEYLLASAIGAASSRLLLSMLLRKRTLSTKAALKLLDDANSAFHYSREIMQSALDHVRQGIAVFDKDFRLVCWNRQFGEILDLPAGMIMVGVSFTDILDVNAKRGTPKIGAIDSLREQLARFAAGNDPFVTRFAERGFVIEVRADRMPDGGIVTTFTDITPSVEAADALERANESLERRVNERTTELTRLNAELARAKAEAEEANISKTRVLAAASHDISQPLNAARLYVTSLVERRRSGEDAELIANIDASLEGVEEIFGALLDMSRLDSGAMKPELTNLRIQDVLNPLEVEFAPLAREKGLRLVVMPCALTVRSDRRLLRRVIQNLVSNAVKYTPRGRVVVGCRRRGADLRIDIYDTGIGIPQSKRRAIFREFHRLDEGARVARGLGLGLSIVERIARVLDHEVDVVSAPKQGSHFSVTVPLSSASPAIQTPRRIVRQHSGHLAGMAVLCIDNEPAILDGMQTLLGGWGCRVVAATGLAAAVNNLVTANVTPSGLLVDYHLDHGNGVGAIIELRRRYGDLPAILITADRSRRLREEAKAYGIDVLNKPVKPAALRALLARWQLQRVVVAAE